MEMQGVPRHGQQLAGWEPVDGLTMAPLGCQKTRPGPAVSLMLNRLSCWPSFR